MTRHNSLLSKFLFCLSLSATALAVTASASAQTQMKVTIPFAFSANQGALPAGSYTLQTQTDDFLYLRNVSTGQTAVLMIRPESGETNLGSSRLTFHRQPGGVYLSQVWTAGASKHIELTTHPKADSEIAKSSPAIATFDIATK